MNYEVQPSSTTPDEWVVEAIDHDSEGEVYSAIFSGPGAKERAEEYAAWRTWRDLAATDCDDDAEEVPTFV
jgi:hypothetical protein